jgi:hypothetical protein
MYEPNTVNSLADLTINDTCRKTAYIKKENLAISRYSNSLKHRFLLLIPSFR